MLFVLHLRRQLTLIYRGIYAIYALVIFAIKVRLSILPTNFTLHLWNRDHNSECPFCHRHTESVAHLLNHCNEFKNFYSRPHDRIVNKIAESIKENKPRARILSYLLAETIFLSTAGCSLFWFSWVNKK